MTNRRALPHLTLAITLAVTAAALGLVTAGRAVELDPAAVAYVTPDQFKWRDPTEQVATNQAILHGDPNKPELYIYINKFKPGRFGNPHYHPNDRFITVIDGAAWRGTGPVLDPTHAARVPKGTFMIDHAAKGHWDATKEESGAYLIPGIAPATNIEVPKNNVARSRGTPHAATIMLPDQIPWQDHGSFRPASLAGHPDKPGLLV